MADATKDPRENPRLEFLQADELLAGDIHVADLVGLEGFAGMRLLAGDTGMTNRVARVNTMQIPTADFARAGDLVLAPTAVFEQADDSRELVATLVDKRVAAIAIRGGDVPGVLGRAAIKSAEQGGVPIIQLSEEVHLSEVQAELLGRLVARQAVQLQVASSIRDELADLASVGGGLPALATELADLLGAQVSLVDRGAEITAASGGADSASAAAAARQWLATASNDPAKTRDGLVIWPIQVGSRRLGCVVAELMEPARARQLTILEQGAALAGLEMMHRLDAEAAASRLRLRLVRDLLGGTLDREATERRAIALGWSIGAPHKIVLARGSGSSATLVDAVRDADEGVVCIQHEGTCLVIVDAGDPGGAEAKIVKALADVAVDVHIGVSEEHESIAELSQAVAEAQESLTTAERFDQRGRVHHYLRADPLRSLAFLPAETLAGFADRTLAPLDALAPEIRDGLMETLRLLIDSQLNVAETSRRGGWHYNTVRYRVARLTELLGPFIDDGTRNEAVALAVRLRVELENRSAAEHSRLLSRHRPGSRGGAKTVGSSLKPAERGA